MKLEEVMLTAVKGKYVVKAIVPPVVMLDPLVVKDDELAVHADPDDP